MNWLKRLFGNRGLKSYDFTTVQSGGSGQFLTINYVASPSSALKSPTYSAAVTWIQRNITEPEMVQEVMTRDGWEVVEESDELETVLAPVVDDRGQIVQTATDRLMGLGMDLPTYGNGYLHMLRGASGRVIGLEWFSASIVTPERRGTSFEISAYSVSAMGGTKRVAPEDMIHVRFGRDPENLHLGRSCIASIGDALNQDAEAAAYMRRMLQNGGSGILGSIKPDALNANKDWGKLAEGVRRNMRNGETFSLLDGDISVSTLGYSPEQMALNTMATFAQQAICAAVGVPAQVLGVMASEKTSTYANMEEAGRNAARNCLGPLWDIIAESISYSLWPDGQTRVRFKWESIQALQENEGALWSRTVDAYKAGVVDRSDAKRYLGIEPLPEDEGYYAAFDRLPPVTGTSQPSQRRRQTA